MPVLARELEGGGGGGGGGLERGGGERHLVCIHRSYYLPCGSNHPDCVELMDNVIAVVLHYCIPCDKR